ncbi:hypothetical protein EAI_12135 [Harpegnathos saltator]|uniref:Uncharacterized protein n=1 Tax=Harpegnathos saltator TaxID=610380 RepID=E2BZ76_HARSA|nr:hypothetical protein EAI_12135 [Harpegnathos saltator]
MLVLRGLQNSNSLVVLGLVILSLVFMIQIKQIYNNNQKYNRYLTYKQYMNEIATELKAVVKSVNKSSTYVRQLNEMLSKYRERSIKNISMSKVTSSS